MTTTQPPDCPEGAATIPATAKSPISSGGTFRFVGLPGSPPDSCERLLVVIGVSTSGSLSYRIDMDGKTGSNLSSIPFSEALLLIEHGVWQPV